MAERFDEPRIALNRIYTKRGDAGETGLVGGQRVPKDTPRIEAYGTVDELNAFVGLAAVSCAEDSKLAALAAILRRVQHELFNLGSILATEPADVHPNQPRVTAADSFSSSTADGVALRPTCGARIRTIAARRPIETIGRPAPAENNFFGITTPRF